MNKVLNINLGGYPFTVDDDAYAHLQNYLNTIRHHFKSSEGVEEITSDIEGRIAELFQETSIGQRPIISLRDVNDAISIMGTPQEFGAESLDETFEPTEKRTYRSHKDKGLKTGKRLFRNPDEEVVGGVCSGIAAYFGIEDPLWVRLGFVIFSLSGGLGIPAYFILWAILPTADSASDKLSMRGEPINVSNIGKIIEEEIDNITDTVSDFGNEFGSKKKSTRQQNPREVQYEEEFLFWENS